MQLTLEGPTPWSGKDHVHWRVWWRQKRVQGRRPCPHGEVPEQEGVCRARRRFEVCLRLGSVSLHPEYLSGQLGAGCHTTGGE